jgi:hypothetical protein
MGANERRARRVAEYSDAYEASINADTHETREAYRRLYKRAWELRECMLCAQPMEKPSTHQALTEDGAKPEGPRMLAHQDCLVEIVVPHGLHTVKTEAQGVGEDGALVSLTTFERPKGADRHVGVWRRPSGVFEWECHVCDTVSEPFESAQAAVDDLKAHTVVQHPGQSLDADWL